MNARQRFNLGQTLPYANNAICIFNWHWHEWDNNIQYTHYENWVDILKHRGALRAHKLKAYAFSSWFFHLALCSCFSFWTHNTHGATACMYPRERESTCIRATRLLLFSFLFRCFEVIWCTVHDAVSLFFLFSHQSHSGDWLCVIEKWHADGFWHLLPTNYNCVATYNHNILCYHTSIFHIHLVSFDMFYEWFTIWLEIFITGLHFLFHRFLPQRFESFSITSNGTKKNSWKNIMMAIKMLSFAMHML